MSFKEGWPGKLIFGYYTQLIDRPGWLTSQLITIFRKKQIHIYPRRSFIPTTDKLTDQSLRNHGCRNSG
jgi:hypothetical protein